MRQPSSGETHRRKAPEGGALVELVVDDGVTLGAPEYLPRQHLVSRQRAGLEVCEVGLGPVRSHVYRSDHDRLRRRGLAISTSCGGVIDGL